MRPRKQLIVNFHGVGDPPAATDPSELDYWLDERSFAAVLDRIDAARDRVPFEILITFDDGNMSDATIALPALLKRGLTAAFFVCAARIGQERYLDTTAMRSLLDAGMVIGSHGANHVNWRKIGDEDLKAEIPLAIESLSAACGRPIDSVAVPFGAYDRRVIRALRRQSLSTVYTSDGGYARSDQWLKPRNTLTQHWQDEAFPALLAGSMGYLSELPRKFAMTYKTMR